jgi:hypothetical protein
MRIRIQDPELWIRDGKIWVRVKHSGSATLLTSLLSINAVEDCSTLRHYTKSKPGRKVERERKREVFSYQNLTSGKLYSPTLILVPAGN